MKTDEIKGETFSMKMHEFGSGARSTEVKPRYDLIPHEALEAIASRFAYGAGRHGENNWVKGVNDLKFIKDRQNHAFEHLHNYITGTSTRRPDGALEMPAEHLAAAICNLAMLCALERRSTWPQSADDADPLDIRKP